MNSFTPLLKTLDMHIEKLEGRLKEIYTVTTPKGYKDNDSDIYIPDHITRLETLESIYSVIDNDNVKYSKTSSEYWNYLEKTREYLSIIMKEKEKVENEYSTEIENINLLLNKFKFEKAKFH